MHKKIWLPFLADTHILGNLNTDSDTVLWNYFLTIDVEVWKNVVLGSITVAAGKNKVEPVIGTTLRLGMHVILGGNGERYLFKAVLTGTLIDAVKTPKWGLLPTTNSMSEVSSADNDSRNCPLLFFTADTVGSRTQTGLVDKEFYRVLWPRITVIVFTTVPWNCVTTRVNTVSPTIHHMAHARTRSKEGIGLVRTVEHQGGACGCIDWRQYIILQST